VEPVNPASESDLSIVFPEGRGQPAWPNLCPVARDYLMTGLTLTFVFSVGRRIDLDLQLHNIAAFRSANQASADFGAALVHRADVAGIVVMIDNLIAV